MRPDIAQLRRKALPTVTGARRAAHVFLRDERGSAAVRWMYPLLLLLILGGISSDSAERRWQRAWTALTADVPVMTLVEAR
jgi:hypothetical protein